MTRQDQVGKRDKGADVIGTSLPEKSEIERRLAFLLVVLERTVVFGEFDLVPQKRMLSSASTGSRRMGKTLENQQLTASTSSHSSEASTFNGDALFGSERAYRKFISTRTGCLRTVFADIGADSPPRRDCSETRMVETESAGDHFSLRMSAVQPSLFVSAWTEAHSGGRASSWENLGNGTGHTEADVAVQVDVRVCQEPECRVSSSRAVNRRYDSVMRAHGSRWIRIGRLGPCKGIRAGTSTRSRRCDLHRRCPANIVVSFRYPFAGARRGGGEGFPSAPRISCSLRLQQDARPSTSCTKQPHS